MRVVITGCDSLGVLDQALRAARGFEPLPAREVEELLARTASAAYGRTFEAYKTTTEHDSTSQHPEWLG